MDVRSVCSHYLQPCVQKKILCSLSVMASYLGVQRKQQMRNSSSNVRGDFYLQPIFGDVILRRHQITREDSMRPWGKNPSLVDLLFFKDKKKYSSFGSCTKQNW